MATALEPRRPAQRMSSGKDILSRMLQMEKQSKVSRLHVPHILLALASIASAGVPNLLPVNMLTKSS